MQHTIVYQGKNQLGNFFECSCGKQASGDWDKPTLNEIMHDHQTNGHLSIIQSAKNVLTNDRSNWCPKDAGFPWGVKL